MTSKNSSVEYEFVKTCNPCRDFKIDFRDLKQRNANDDGNAYLHSISENFISNAVSLRGCQDSFFVVKVPWGI